MSLKRGSHNLKKVSKNLNVLTDEIKFTAQDFKKVSKFEDELNKSKSNLADIIIQFQFLEQRKAEAINAVWQAQKDYISELAKLHNVDASQGKWNFNTDTSTLTKIE